MAAFGKLIRLKMEPLRSLAFGSISGTYAGIGTAFTRPARTVLFQNLTDVTLLFSLNGVDDHFRLASNTSFVLDVTANKSDDGGLYVAEGTRIYVKEDSSSPSSGTADVTAIGATE